MTEVLGAPARTAARAPVMADVARLAGVSHQTVSRVINGHPHIRPHTRTRVEDAIRQLGYRPNTAARTLVTRRSATIGVIGSFSGHWGPTSVHRTVEAAAAEAGYFASSVSSGLDFASLRAAIDHLLAQAVEGIVMIAAQDEALEAVRAQEPGVPLVIVEGDLSKARWAVGVDQVAGSRMATQHLLDLGHTEIAHVCGPLDWTEARARRDGWRQAMTDAGLRPAEPVLGDWTAASGYAAGQQLAQRPEVTAVVAANDQMAVGIIRALTEAGRDVPADVSVVGFDDIPESGFLVPPLTTVHQDFPAVGRRAIEVLHAAIVAEDEDLPRLIAPDLVVRSSTAPPPGGTP
ncbi:LacI family DNA-binding transcriptional regulator [Solicola sp. PLA-1-18]|uniref:LacI family DNA-binding transcriptional regulator n=1 Tax=Solicola sp. PLA-1-18 TaxID=3380532 RepID=UPI003B7A2BA7